MKYLIDYLIDYCALAGSLALCAGAMEYADASRYEGQWKDSLVSSLALCVVVRRAGVESAPTKRATNETTYKRAANRGPGPT